VSSVLPKLHANKIYSLECHANLSQTCIVIVCTTGRKGVQGAQPGPVLDWMQRVKIAIEAAKGIEYLHEKV
jgi:hypothetical protein